MQYFAIAMSALLVTTRSPKDCEAGWFTGYLITLPLFSCTVICYLVCFCVLLSLKVKSKYYSNFFLIAMLFVLFTLLINLFGNIFSGNDCGFYSIRGFAVSLITVCTAISYVLVIFLEFIGELFEKMN
jgi:hypothetical protein